ncbi:hypothetical protein [Streptomyces sp. NPDC014806]|uniref:hypothetical protein n=1 Tax=Streptomyces sp. NPDC014806 TaxID=3364920 RepID=UPI0036FF0155
MGGLVAGVTVWRAADGPESIGRQPFVAALVRLPAQPAFWDTGHPDPDQWTCNLWLLHQPPPAWHPFDGTATELLLALTTRAHPHATVLVPSDPAPPRWTRTEDWRHRPAPTSQTEGGMHR